MTTSPVRLRRRYFVLALIILDLLLVGAVASWFSGRPPGGNADGQRRVVRLPGSKVRHQIYIPLALLSQHPERPGLGPTTTSAAIPAPSPDPGDTTLQARIELVWPHAGASSRDANLANITVYLINGSGNEPLPCAAEPVVRLWRALNTESARPVGVGQKRMQTSAGHTFPVWDFNDVDVRAAREPGNRLTFFATVEGIPVRHNVWVHGADARTVFPQAETPVSVTNRLPALLDARIQILWPHDGLPLDRAQLANLTAYVFDAQTGRALAPEVARGLTLRLHEARNNEPDGGQAASRVGALRTVTGPNGQRFAAWDFNDVDVSAARDSLNKQHFWLSADGRPAFTNIWSHGAAASTIYPQALALTSCR